MTLFQRLKKRRLMVTVAAAAMALSALAATPAMATATSAGSATAQPADYKRACPIGKPGTFACMMLTRTNTHAAGFRLAGPVPGAYTPADLAAAYHLNTAGGTGQTVAIVDAYDDPNAESDLALYRAQYGLPACTKANGCFQELNQEGNTSPLPNLQPSDLNWGQEITFSSGDSSHGGGVIYPAASQYVVAVGGTSLAKGTGRNLHRARGRGHQRRRLGIRHVR